MSASPNRALVTGAQGFIGRWLVDHWLDEDASLQVLGIGRSPRQDSSFTHHTRWCGRTLRAPLPAGLGTRLAAGRYDYARADLSQPDALAALLAAFRPTHVVHLAAALRDHTPDVLTSTNVLGVENLLAAIARSGHRPRRIVLGSTGGVYGRATDEALPLRETAPCLPIDPYSVSKWTAEQRAQALADRHALPVVRARIFNPVGPGLDDRHLCASLARQCAEIAAGLAEPRIEVGPLVTTRDFVDVRDVSRALVALAVRGEPGRAYNLCSGRETLVERVLDHLRGRLAAAAISGAPSLVVHRLPGRKADVARHFGAIDGLRELDAAPLLNWQTGLDALFDWYREQVATLAAAR